MGVGTVVDRENHP